MSAYEAVSTDGLAVTLQLARVVAVVVAAVAAAAVLVAVVEVKVGFCL